MARKRIFMVGLRGIPDVQGGVEKHVEALSQLCADKGYDVTVIGRRNYLKQKNLYRWRNVFVVPLYAPCSPYLEALVNSIAGVFYAARHKADILHIHAIGPALTAPLARVLGLKVVVTHHGFDYDRQKWGAVARKVLKLGEYVGMKYSNARIAVSRNIAGAMQKRYGVEVEFIPNGVSVFEGRANADYLKKFQLTPDNYLINVARIVPEKRQLDLINAYADLNRPDIPLVLVGGGNEYSDYYMQVAARAGEVAGVIMTGALAGEELAAIFSNAGMFILPSSHEGMPIALLEALHYDMPVLASDIVANKEIGLEDECYFPLGDIAALTRALERQLIAAKTATGDGAERTKLQHDFSWDHIADQTCAIYEKVLSGSKQ
ncbi:glycosyltransferase involved in cell wall biosynthesis [Paenochrobactrum gallinarii]|uniref:Glycosyltransferase involved in cell wall biosynthesis n=1 Tax=Paenochrobactrum gallinarii TaxID=643673 RepID=A0A841LVG1_9HYPH|nr:glycosyltransferase involved in cell wall biosynthesis [Paenochrobactrum gallinarii]